jgi:hypothetical protein
MWAAWGLTTLGLALMTLLRPTSSPAEQYLFPVIASLGGGIILPGRLLSVQAAQKDEDAPLATTMVSFMLSLGQAFGVGVGGSILENRWDDLIATSKTPIPARFVITGKNLLSAWRKVPAFPKPLQLLYQQITAKSISTLYAVLAVLAGIALLTSFFSEDLTLDKDARGRQQFATEHEDSSTAHLLRSDNLGNEHTHHRRDAGLQTHPSTKFNRFSDQEQIFNGGRTMIQIPFLHQNRGRGRSPSNSGRYELIEGRNIYRHTRDMSQSSFHSHSSANLDDGLETGMTVPSLAHTYDPTAR